MRTCPRRRYKLIVVCPFRGLDSRIYRFARPTGLSLRHYTHQSPSNLHGRRQPSNRLDGSLGTQRWGGLRLRGRRSSPSPKGLRGAKTHSPSLTMCEKCFSTYMWLRPFQSLRTEELSDRHFDFYLCIEFSLGIYGDLKIDSFFFWLRRNSVLDPKELNSSLYDLTDYSKAY